MEEKTDSVGDVLADRRVTIAPMIRRVVSVLALLCALASSLLPLRAAASARFDPSAPAQVLVVGGTPAGIAAAISAARRGLRVELVCERPYLGGILTGGMMNQWDLNKTDDRTDIEAGIFREMYDRLGESFDPEQAKTVLLRMVQQEPGITLRLSTELLSADVTGSVPDRRISGVTFVDRRSGAHFTLYAPLVIDATDTGELAARAGARYDVGRQDTGLDTKMQAATLMFAVDGVNWSETANSYDEGKYGVGGTTDRKVWGFAKVLRGYRPLSLRSVVRDLNLGREPNGTVTVNAVDIVGVDGRNPWSVAEGMQIGRAEIVHLMGFLRDHIPGFAHARLAAFADELYVRETRHIRGLTTLTADDVWHGRIPYDTIGLSSYPLDLHPCYVGEEPAFAPIRHVYGVPFRAMVPFGFDNLLVAGPAISATHVAAGSARIVPTTVEEGEAAGTAAAFALRHGDDFPKIALNPKIMQRLRAALARAGAIVDVAGR